MASFFNNDTSFGTNTGNFDWEFFTSGNTKEEKPRPAEKIPTKREQNQNNLRKVQEEMRKRAQKKLR